MSKFKIFKSIKKVFNKRLNSLSLFKSKKPETITVESVTLAIKAVEHKNTFWRSLLSFFGYKAGQVVIPAAASLVARTKAKEAMVGRVGSFVAGVIAEHAGATAYNLSSVYAGPIGAATILTAVSAKDFIREVYDENTYGLDAEDLADAAIEYNEKLIEDGFVDIKTNELPIPPVRPSTIEMVNVTQRRQPRQTVGLFDSALSDDSLFSSTSSLSSTSSSTQEPDSTLSDNEILVAAQEIII